MKACPAIPVEGGHAGGQVGGLSVRSVCDRFGSARLSRSRRPFDRETCAYLLLLLRSCTLRSLQTAPKGSYREEHVIIFLQRWLPEWSEERQKAHDWRILYLDAYAAHLTERVRDLAFERGFVLLYHGGGTTGVTQVNDTDLHAAFEREYLDAETQAFFWQSQADPGNISRTRQQIIDDVCAVWRGLDHSQGVRGHKRTGLSVSLDGSEDHLLIRDARLFWDELQFGAVRDEAVARVRHAVDRGELSWCQEDIDKLREPFPDNDAGMHVEGQELQCVMEDDERQYTDSEHEGAVSSDDDLASDCEPQGFGHASGALVPVDLPVLPSDAPEEVEEATRIAERIQTLERVDAFCRGKGLLQVQFEVQRKMREVTKLKGTKTEEGRPSALLRRFVRLRREKEEESLRALREANQARNQERRRLKDLERKQKKAEEAKKAWAKAKQAALAKLPKEFTMAMLGHGHKEGGTRVHCVNREVLLERLRLRSPPLPLELQASWNEFKRAYVRYTRAAWKETAGLQLFEKVRDVMKKLGDHLLREDGSPPSIAEPVGNADAFAAFVRKSRKRLPEAADTLRL